MSVHASPSPSEATRDRRSTRLLPHTIGLAGTVIAVDQASKFWATSALSGGKTIPVLGDLLTIRLTYNSGAAFSIGAGSTWIFTIITAVAAAVGLYLTRRVGTRLWALALGLLLGGASTHLLDRLFRQPGFARGHVVDFIDYAGFFVGNVADIALVSGAALWMLLTLRGVHLDGTRAPRQD